MRLSSLRLEFFAELGTFVPRQAALRPPNPPVMKTLLRLAAALAALALHPCASAQEPAAPFALPEIPTVLTAPAERADYLTYHYWDRFDFADPSLFVPEGAAERAFVDFLSVLPLAPQADRAWARLFGRLRGDAERLLYFADLGDKYLGEAASPLCDEGQQILFLEALLADEGLPEEERIRPRVQLRLARMNRPGTVAADFEYEGRDGVRHRLSDLRAERILLFLNDPECADCRRTKAFLVSSPVVREALRAGRLALLSVCVEGDTPSWRAASVPEGWTDGCDALGALTDGEHYYLKTMPALLLLDGARRVLLKDASVEDVERLLTADR